MKVYGYTLPPEAERYAVAWMSAAGSFHVRDLSSAMERVGVNRMHKIECANRLIQRERKAGNIAQVYGRGLWSWVRKEKAA
jgi:hypothetical protein